MNRPAKLLLPLAFFAGAGWFLFIVRGELFPFVLAAAFAYLLNPLVGLFEVNGLRRAAVVGILYALLAGGAAVGGFLGLEALSREVAQLRASAPLYETRGREALAELRDIQSGRKEWKSPALRRLSALRGLPGVDLLVDEAADDWQAWAGRSLHGVSSLALYAFPILEFTLLVPFIAFFFMVGGPSMRDSVLDFVPARYVEMVLNLVVEIDNSLGNYLRCLLLEALLVTALAVAGCWLIGLDYAIQVSILIGATNAIPYLGPVLGFAGGALVAVLQWGSVEGAVKVALVCAGVQLVDNWLLEPLLIDSVVQLHPVLLLFSLLAGEQLWGFWGLLFAVPLACVVKVVLQIGWDWYRSEYGIRLPEQSTQSLRLPLV